MTSAFFPRQHELVSWPMWRHQPKAWSFLPALLLGMFVSLVSCARNHQTQDEAAVASIIDAAFDKDYATFKAIAGNVPVDLKDKPDYIVTTPKFVPHQFDIDDVRGMLTNNCWVSQVIKQQGDTVDLFRSCRFISDTADSIEFKFRSHKLVHVYMIFMVLG